MAAKQRPRPSKYQHQPELGVKHDFETLLHRFASASTVRYAKFAEIWKEMKFSLYCAGRETFREAREFVEECFKIAVQFWLPPSSFLVRAGALYLLYGLYYFQLVAPKVKIRITAKDWQSVVEFQDEAREQQHLDLDYIFQKLLVDKAFIFAATQDEILPNSKDTDSKMIPDGMKEDTSSVEEVFSSTALNQLALIQDQYQKIKIALNDQDPVMPDSSLNIVHADFIQGVYKTLHAHREKCQSVQTQKTFEDESELLDAKPGLSQKKNIKRKAYETSLGFYRRSGRKNSQGGGEQDSLEETDSQEDSRCNKVETRGRRKTVMLYEADDQGPEDKEPLPRVDLLADMPDLLPRLDIEEGNSSSPTALLKGKRSVSRARKVKGRKSVKDSATDQILQTDDRSKVSEQAEPANTEDNNDGEMNLDKTAGRKRKRKTPPVKYKDDQKERKKKVRKVIVKESASNDNVAADSVVQGDAKDSKSAQQKLLDKLNNRKKQSRKTKRKKSK